MGYIIDSYAARRIRAEPPVGFGELPSRVDAARLLRRRAERRDLALAGQTLQRLQLDLPNALARDSHLAADLLERLRVGVAVHAVAELDHLLLAVGQPLDRAPQRLLAQAENDLLLDVAGLVGDELAERGVALASD